MLWTEIETITARQNNRWYFTDPVSGVIFRVKRLAANQETYKGIVARWRYDDDGDRLLYGFRKFYARDQAQIINLNTGYDDLNIAGFAFKVISKTVNPLWDIRIDVLDDATTMRTETPVSQSSLDNDGKIQINHNLGARVLNFAVTDPTGLYFNIPARFVNDNVTEFDFSGFTPLDGIWIVGIERR